jgi:hypothetical protein
MSKETAITEEFAEKLAPDSRSAELRSIGQLQLALVVARQKRLQIPSRLPTRSCRFLNADGIGGFGSRYGLCRSLDEGEHFRA